MSDTTIKVHLETKEALDGFREYKNESYDELIRKMVYIARNIKKNPELSKETIDAIDAARKRMKTDYLTEDQARKRLGL